MTKLFLDDIRIPTDCTTYMWRENVNVDVYRSEWDIVRSYKEFVDYINDNGIPDLISFDHDLGDVDELKANLPIDNWFDLDNEKEYTGYDCAKYLIDYCLDNEITFNINYHVHSSNPAGALNIKSLIDNFNKRNEYNESQIK